MNNSKNDKSWIGGLLLAVSASICCITPVLALLSGAGGIAATFSWLEPARPYLIGITFLVLGFAWYQKLKPRKQEEIDCDCEDETKSNFWQSKTFLGLVTVAVIALLTFPSYSHIFYPKTEKQAIVIAESSILTAEFSISGMTCSSCEEHVKHAVNKMEGVLESSVDHAKGAAVIKFDGNNISVDRISEAINATGYKVEKYSIKNN